MCAEGGKAVIARKRIPTAAGQDTRLTPGYFLFYFPFFPLFPAPLYYSPEFSLLEN